MGKKLGPAEWEQIVMNRVYGMSNAKNSEAVGVSTASITSTLAAFDAVKEQDWAKCCNIIVTYDTGIEVFNWAGQKTGRQIPPIIQQSYEKWREERRKQNLDALKTKEEQEKKPEPAKADQDKAALMLARMTAAIEKQNELLESLLDVVIPKYVGDLKDNINVNCDVLNQTAKSCDDKLEAIKLAFRKKGL